MQLVSITTNYDDVKTVETNKKVLSQGKFHDNFQSQTVKYRISIILLIYRAHHYVTHLT